MNYVGKVYGKFGRKYIELDMSDEEPKQLTIDELRKQFESIQIKVYGISYAWLKRFDTGNYKDNDMERDWKAHQQCARANNIIKDGE